MRLKQVLLFSLLLLAAGLFRADGSGEAAATNRPKIGLVLSGGGAKGIAHIGVLKILEELNVPIDYIAGTSMGAIIGGLYASGLSPDEIQQVLMDIDWNDALRDSSSRQYLTFRRKEDNRRYLLDLEMGVKNFKLLMQPGLLSGYKLEYYLQTATLHASTIRDFDRLNIPYRAVATDVDTGEKVVLAGGDFANAMRASMAVPGLFSPVEVDGRMLVDGGLVDNMPVDVVRGMGAEVVIAVDVGAAADRGAKGPKTLLDITGRMMAILTRANVQSQSRDADLVLKPDLTGLSPADFALVNRFVPRGEQCVQTDQDALKKYAADPDRYRAWLERQRSKSVVPLRVASVRIEGNQQMASRAIESRIKTRPGDPLDRDRIRKDLARIYGIGDFEKVSYRVFPTNDACALVYDVKEKFWGPDYLHYGLHLEGDFKSSATYDVLVNYSRMRLNPFGGEWRNEVQIGQNPRLETELYQPLDYDGYFFVSPGALVERQIQDWYDGDQRVAEYNIVQSGARLDAGMQFTEYGELRGGVLRGLGNADVEVGATNLPSFDGDIGALTAKLTLDRIDNSNFPRNGSYLEVSGFFSKEFLGAEDEYDKVSAEFMQYASVGHHTFSLRLNGGSNMGSLLPIYDEFLLGGFYSFSGYGEGELRGQYFGVGSLGYFYRIARLPATLGEGVYAGGWFDAGNVWDRSEDIKPEILRVGGTVALGADTVIGPIFLAYGQAEREIHRFYFSLGRTF